MITLRCPIDQTWASVTRPFIRVLVDVTYDSICTSRYPAAPPLAPTINPNTHAPIDDEPVVRVRMVMVSNTAGHTSNNNNDNDSASSTFPGFVFFFVYAGERQDE